MKEKKMKLKILLNWLDRKNIPYEINRSLNLIVKDSLTIDFRNWVKVLKYTHLPDELVSVEGDFYLDGTHIVTLNNVAFVLGSLDISFSKISNLGKLKSIGGSLIAFNVPLVSLGELTSIKENMFLFKTMIQKFYGNIFVGKDLDLLSNPITTLDSMPHVGRYLIISQDQLHLLNKEVHKKVQKEIQYLDLEEIKWVTV